MGRQFVDYKIDKRLGIDLMPGSRWNDVTDEIYERHENKRCHHLGIAAAVASVAASAAAFAAADNFPLILLRIHYYLDSAEAAVVDFAPLPR